MRSQTASHDPVDCWRSLQEGQDPGEPPQKPSRSQERWNSSANARSHLITISKCVFLQVFAARAATTKKCLRLSSHMISHEGMQHVKQETLTPRWEEMVALLLAVAPYVLLYYAWPLRVQRFMSFWVAGAAQNPPNIRFQGRDQVSWVSC